MKSAVSKNVVTVSVDASTWNDASFWQYGGGIFDDASSCGTSLDHAVAAVGYGTDTDGTEYWLIRNSWSTYWGEEGYIKLQITGDNAGMCGVQLASFYANAQVGSQAR